MAPVFGRPQWVIRPGNKTRCEHACVPHVLSLLCLRSTEPSPESSSFSLCRSCCVGSTVPAPLPPSLLPRASFPVPLSLPAAGSFDFVSDFPRKGLWGGHGVKNTTFLMHSLGKQAKGPHPLSVVAWHVASFTCRSVWLGFMLFLFLKFQLCHAIVSACPCCTKHACSTFVSLSKVDNSFRVL